MLKYEFTNETKVVNSTTLHRIRRLADGLVGGWLESEQNLSQAGNCFVYDNARVLGDAQVSGKALVSGNAQVYGDAQVSGNVWVYGDAQVSGKAQVYGDAQVSGDAKISKSNQLVTISGFTFLVTITPQNMAIGCQVKTHKEWLKVTQKQAIEMGLPKEEYTPIKVMVKASIKHITKGESK